MKWQRKAFVLRQLSNIPGGKSCYLMLQKFLGTTRVQPRRDLQRAVELLQLINEAGQSVRGARCYEIGTGWHPFTPLAFYLAGAQEIVTVDVNPWLSLASARQTIKAAADHLSWLAETLQRDEQEIRQRYQKINLNATDLPTLLASMGTIYQYPADARESGQPAESFDFVISSNVLEHIPPQILQDIMTEAFRILQPGGLNVHRFNPGDHYANDDPRVTTVHFLQFSEQEWEKYGSGLAYHNRLRCPEFSRIFEQAGFSGLIENQRVEPRALATLQQAEFKLHADFASYTQEELAADYMWSVGLKPTISARNAALSAPATENALPSCSSSETGATIRG